MTPDEYVFQCGDVLVTCNLEVVRVDVGGRLAVICRCRQDDPPHVRIWCNGAALDVAAGEYGPETIGPHYPENEA